ncbi:MAG: ABC transporter substrate-binding protein [Chloroflexi bacterium]|nr:ABC transporter substrate-binding protein [Chloroflexota bacterium]MDA1147853.1 ABC transporter substrate-binding protein [Chloroflexota bacterium]
MTESNYWLGSRSRKLSRRSMLRGAVIGGAGLAGAVLVGCGDDDEASGGTGTDAPSEAVAARGPVVTTGISSNNFFQLDPVTGTGGDEHQFLWMVYDNLVGYDETLTPQLSRSLAESWETPDELTLVFKLRPNLKFHDGSAVTADEVKWHIERARDLDIAVTAQDIQFIENVETVDELTSRWTLSQPFAPLIRILGDRAGMLVSRKQVEATDEFQGRHPTGTGAMKFVEEIDGDRIVLEANNEYWKPNAPRVDGIVMRFGVTPDQKINGLLAGDLDIIDAPDPNQLDTLTGAGLVVQNIPTNGLTRTWINMNKDPWTNVHLRRALNWAVDKEQLNDLVFNGLNTPAHFGFLGPALGSDHDPNFEGYRFDPEKVRAELSLAGFPDGFEYEVNTSSNPLSIEKDELIQAQYAQFGIVRNIIPKPSPDFYTEFWDLNVGSHSSGMSVRADVWQQIAYIANANGFSKNVLPGPDDEFRIRIDEALAKSAAAFDPEERKAALGELNRAYVDAAWGVDYLYNSYQVAHKPEIDYVARGEGKFHFGQDDIGWKA